MLTVSRHQETLVRLHRLPPGTDEEALVMLSDVLPTAFECGVLIGRVGPGDTVAILGAGPIGLVRCSPASSILRPHIVIDPDPNPLQIARSLGATVLVQGGDVGVVPRVQEVTGGAGVDVVAAGAFSLAHSTAPCCPNTSTGLVASDRVARRRPGPAYGSGAFSASDFSPFPQI